MWSKPIVLSARCVLSIGLHFCPKIDCRWKGHCLANCRFQSFMKISKYRFGLHEGEGEIITKHLF